MAFVFDPNPNEGDKQTNSETGVEYIYTGGAWRALGPKIEDEFDTLDERYIKRDGTTVVSDYYRLRGPNTAGDGTSTFQVIESGKLKLYNVQKPEDSNTGWAANVEYVQEYVTNEIAAIPPVSFDGYATEDYVNASIDSTKDYVDTAIDGIQLDGALIYKGVVSDEISLPDDALLGEFYYATSENKYFAWNGSAWQEVGSVADVNLDEYLPLAGGTMAGALILGRVGSNQGGFEIKGWDDAGNNINLLRVFHNTGSGRADAVNYLGRQDGDDNIITNKWMKDYLTGAYLPLAGGTMTGKITSDVNSNTRVDFKSNSSSANCDIARNGDWKVSFQTDRIKVNTLLDMNSHKITGVSDPTNSNDAMNKNWASNNLTHGKFKITSSSGNFYIEAN